MHVVKLIFKNLFRHKLRTVLTIVGIAIAVMAFGLIRTVIDAWYVGIEASSPNRLITRHAVSFIFPLPLAYTTRLQSITGVTEVSHATWFQGIYIEQQNFFPRIAVDPEVFINLYPEFVLPADQLAAWKKERNSCLLGIKTAKKFNLKIGDLMTVQGDIYPGEYQFVVRGIYRGAKKSTDATQMFFHWSYLDERLRRDAPIRSGMVGWYVIHIANPEDASRVSEAADALFKNSSAETKTETEEAFTLGFISMSSTILKAMQFISYIIIGIILLVLANTMVMTARERRTEYAVLKTLGFTGFHLTGLIAGESLMISVFGGGLGLLLSLPVIHGVAEQLSNFFPIFTLTTATLTMSFSFAILVGIIASIFPIYRALNTRIVDGLRQIG